MGGKWKERKDRGGNISNEEGDSDCNRHTCKRMDEGWRVGGRRGGRSRSERVRGVREEGWKREGGNQ